MPSQILLFDQSRSASKCIASKSWSMLINSSGHLHERILSQQERLSFLNGTFSECRGAQVGWLMSENWAEGVPPETSKVLQEKAAAGEKKWRDALEEAKKAGQILFLHDHPFSTFLPELIQDYINNRPPTQAKSDGAFTMMPSNLLLRPGTVPVLTIRDPRLAVPSAYRVLKSMGLPHGSGRPNFLISTATMWQRMLYEFFESNNIHPLVVDADDIMTSRGFVEKLCQELELDPNQCIFQWEARSKESMHPMLYASQQYLMDSTAVDPGRAGVNLDLDAEESRWEKEFGDDVGLVREAVARSRSHYLWLRERSFRG